jgi:hypothetical protein
LDAVDEETGERYLEQVAEFEDKMTGDIVADIAYKYGILYNEALIVTDNTNGYGEIVSLSLVARKYPNIYYGINVQKDYMKDDSTKEFETPKDEKLPGMHIKSQRTFMISKFCEMLGNNSMRIRSLRTISEAETWIVKNGRVDHASGCHDDTLIALAMGVYVFENYLVKNEAQNTKTKTMLSLMGKNWQKSLVNNHSNSNSIQNQTPEQPRKPVGFFTSSSAKKDPKRFYASPMPNNQNGYYTYNPFQLL